MTKPDGDLPTPVRMGKPLPQGSGSRGQGLADPDGLDSSGECPESPGQAEDAEGRDQQTGEMAGQSGHGPANPGLASPGPADTGLQASLRTGNSG